MRAAAYLRVSTIAQADADRFGYGRQAHEVREYAQKNNLELVREYRDAITGKSITRVGLQQLKADAASYDVVLISGVDRLARDVGASYQVLAELIDLGLVVHSAEFGLVDLDDDQSLIQFNLRSLFSHLERNKIVSRTRAGRKLMAEKGLLPGGIRTFGYRGDGQGGAEIVPEQAAVVRRIFQARVDGHSFRRIATSLQADRVPVARPHRGADGKGRWAYGQVATITRNRAYKGEYHFTLDGAPYVFDIPPIVSRDVWEAAQARKRGAPPKLDWPLLGHIRCGTCGRRMHAKQRRRNGEVRWQGYRCQAMDRPELECGQGVLNREWLEEIVEAEIRSRFADEEFVRSLLSAAAQHADVSATARVQQLEEERSRVLTAYRRGLLALEEFAAARQEIDKSIRALSEVPDVELPVPALMRAAQELPLRDFLDYSGIVVVASRDFIAFELE